MADYEHTREKALVRVMIRRGFFAAEGSQIAHCSGIPFQGIIFEDMVRHPRCAVKLFTVS